MLQGKGIQNWDEVLIQRQKMWFWGHYFISQITISILGVTSGVVLLSLEGKAQEIPAFPPPTSSQRRGLKPIMEIKTELQT